MGEYPYPLFDEKGKVVCQICGKSFLVISPKHLQKHNIFQYSDYTRRFPEAPLSNKEFAARGKYGKNKNMFIYPDNEDSIIEDDFNEPEVEEMDDIEKFIQNEVKSINPMKTMKIKLRDHLRLYFSNIEMDYLIRQFETNNSLVFEFITDFCDPILKVVIQFPDTFWHNNDIYIDLNKNEKLKKYGWKVFEINSNNPSLDELDKMLENY